MINGISVINCNDSQACKPGGIAANDFEELAMVAELGEAVEMAADHQFRMASFQHPFQSEIRSPEIDWEMGANDQIGRVFEFG
jgi:hypothetical protein